jgi:hypothetical protein
MGSFRAAVKATREHRVADLLQLDRRERPRSLHIDLAHERLARAEKPFLDYRDEVARDGLHLALDHGVAPVLQYGRANPLLPLQRARPRAEAM